MRLLAYTRVHFYVRACMGVSCEWIDVRVCARGV